jgi:hypothetical protein
MNRYVYTFIVLGTMFLLMFFGGWIAGAACLAFFTMYGLVSGRFTRKEVKGERNREIR